MANAYRHTQIGWVILASVAVVLAIVVPPLVAAGLSGWAAATVGFFVVMLLLFGTLTIRVAEGTIVASFGVGAFRKRVALDEVRSVEEVRNPWYWGWGIRFYPGGTLYNVSGLSAVEVRLRDGKRYRFGTDEPEKLRRAIEEVTGKLPPLTPEEQREDRRRVRRGRLVLLGVSLAIIALVAASFSLWMRPPRVTVGAAAFEVKSCLYGDSVAYGDIVSVTLEERLPRILLRTNGFALGRALRGHFRLEELGDGQLFVELGKPPYVLVRKRDGFVIVNFEDPERTRRLYDALRPRVASARLARCARAIAPRIEPMRPSERLARCAAPRAPGQDG